MIVLISKDALKFINSQDAKTRDRFRSALKGLSEDPPVGDIRPLVGNPPFLRLRVGDCRVVFFDDCGVRRVVKIKPRGQIYKRGG